MLMASGEQGQREMMMFVNVCTHYPFSTKLALVLGQVLLRIIRTIVLPSEPAHTPTSFEQIHCNQECLCNGGVLHNAKQQ